MFAAAKINNKSICKLDVCHGENWMSVYHYSKSILKGYLTNKEDHNSYHWGVILEFRNKISKSQLLIKNQLLLLEFKEYYKLLYMCTYDCNHH